MNLSLAFPQFQAQTMSQGTALFSCGLMGKGFETDRNVLYFTSQTGQGL